MLRNRFMVFIFLLLLITAYSVEGLCSAESTEQEANSAISKAEGSLNSAYISVIEVEKAGGDVAGLVNGLNGALEYVSASKNFLAANEFDAAKADAERAEVISDSVAREAAVLRSLATSRGEIQFRDNLILSSLLAIAIALIGFRGWFVFKGHYLRRMAGMKPEVVRDEP